MRILRCLYEHDEVKVLIKGNCGNTSHIKIFLILCIQLVLCMDCQFMK